MKNWITLLRLITAFTYLEMSLFAEALSPDDLKEIDSIVQDREVETMIHLNLSKSTPSVRRSAHYESYLHSKSVEYLEEVLRRLEDHSIPIMDTRRLVAMAIPLLEVNGVQATHEERASEAIKRKIRECDDKWAVNFIVRFFYHHGVAEDIPFLKEIAALGSEASGDVAGTLEMFRNSGTLRKSRLGSGSLQQKEATPDALPLDFKPQFRSLRNGADVAAPPINPLNPVDTGQNSLILQVLIVVILAGVLLASAVRPKRKQ